jgi:hypothetical protein
VKPDIFFVPSFFSFFSFSGFAVKNSASRNRCNQRTIIVHFRMPGAGRVKALLSGKGRRRCRQTGSGGADPHSTGMARYSIGFIKGLQINTDYAHHDE